MKKIDFETNEPLFSEKELHDAISCVAMCITQAIKTREFNADDWMDYLIRWNEQMFYPETALKHINMCISQSLNTLGIHE